MIKRKVIGITAAALLSAAAGFVTLHEGVVLGTYKDPVGITTACVGHVSKDLKIGQTFTAEECQMLLENDLHHAFSVIDRRVKVTLAPSTKIALASFIFNVGEGNFSRSTLLKKLNDGNVVGACNELSRWVYAGGKKLNGLVKRREEERLMCLDGLKEKPKKVFNVVRFYND